MNADSLADECEERNIKTTARSFSTDGFPSKYEYKTSQFQGHNEKKTYFNSLCNIGQASCCTHSNSFC